MTMGVRAGSRSFMTWGVMSNTSLVMRNFVARVTAGLLVVFLMILRLSRAHAYNVIKQQLFPRPIAWCGNLRPLGSIGSAGLGR